MPRRVPPNLVHSGTKVNALFTIAEPKRYGSAMLLLVAAAALASSPPAMPTSHVGPSGQARARIRIISGATLRLGVGALSGQAPPVQPTFVHADGEPRPARLIEFQ